MEFSSEILKCIVQFGNSGKTPFEIAKELNMTLNEVRDERLINKEFDKAFIDAEYNYEQFKLNDLVKNPTSEIKKLMYERITQKHGNGFDNEIKITEV